jgi:hypothetical protein
LSSAKIIGKRCSRELRESAKLAVGRIMAREELGSAKKISCMI